MSESRLTEFIHKADEDEALQQKLQATTCAEEVVAIGKEAGYEFSASTVMEYGWVAWWESWWKW
ncbi:Nif11-like leader peptide family natural product precursor [Cyanobium sp. WKJ7-Wakatipu]|uniref:Nif11-like leader peptide family natural product precursor n=1 Tax=Cyanobium sp. WKJ7-Wakatipu TaxID=2823726 RepID=UPI0037C037ED|nr:Nif11-like leader peptide family natural product precursor [Cyanobium sp. WKJ7-Wakatipu]